MCINVGLLFIGEWITPTVTGDRPPPIRDFTLKPVTNNTAVLFGGDPSEDSVYIIDFTKTSVVSVLITMYTAKNFVITTLQRLPQFQKSIV